VFLHDFEKVSVLVQCIGCHQQYHISQYSFCDFKCRNIHCKNTGGCEYVLITKYGQNYIWACNESHLNYLEAFTKARTRCQRQHYTRSIFSRLPSFYRSNKCRDDVLNKLQELRKRIKI
jgi:hypothetical protein